MIFSRLRPAFTATTPAGGSILTESSRLTNNRPRAKTQFTWTAGAQTTTTTMTIELDWTGSIAPRVVAILGTDLPAGLPVAIEVWNGSAFVAPAAPNSGSIVQRPDGRAAAIVLPAGIAATTKAQLILTNDIAGATVMTGGQLFTIGEAWIGQADQLDLINSWQRLWDDTTKLQWSFDKQPFVRKGVAGNVFTFTPKPSDAAYIYGSDTDPSALDLDSLNGSMFGGQPVLCVPQYLDETGAYSNRIASRSACFGFATQMPSFERLAAGLHAPGAVKITAPAIY